MQAIIRYNDLTVVHRASRVFGSAPNSISVWKLVRFWTDLPESRDIAIHGGVSCGIRNTFTVASNESGLYLVRVCTQILLSHDPRWACGSIQSAQPVSLPDWQMRYNYTHTYVDGRQCRLQCSMVQTTDNRLSSRTQAHHTQPHCRHESTHALSKS